MDAAGPIGHECDPAGEGGKVQVHRLTSGDDVVKGMAVGKLPVTATHCFGASTFRLNTGEVAYLGDFIPYMAAPLAAAMKPATLHNGATFACAGITMTRWDIDGLAAMPTPVAAK